jgi:NitT/TauT family transport system permease protein
MSNLEGENVKVMRAKAVLLALVLLLLLWQVLAWIVNLAILPSPWEVGQTLIRELGRDLPGHFLSSFWRVFASTLLAILFASPLGLMLGQSKPLDRFFAPVIYLLYPIPKVVLLPIVVLF